MSAFRFFAFNLCLAASLLLPAVSASAQQKSPASGEGSNKGTDIVLTAADGWPVHISYFESPDGQESPVVILLTSTEGPDKKDARNRQIWQPTAVALQKERFAVVTVDLRKHGDSIPPAAEGKESALKMSAEDYALMATLDLEVVKAFLLKEHAAKKLNIRKTGIVSMGASAMVASAFTVADWDKKPYPDGPTPATSTPRGQDVLALIAYSPSMSVKGINSVVVLRALKALPVAVHVVASKDNKEDHKNADKYFKAVDPKNESLKEFRKLTSVPGEIRLERFLEGKFAEATIKDITDFLTMNLKNLEIPWAERRDRRTN